MAKDGKSIVKITEIEENPKFRIFQEVTDIEVNIDEFLDLLGVEDKFTITITPMGAGEKAIAEQINSIPEVSIHDGLKIIGKTFKDMFSGKDYSKLTEKQQDKHLDQIIYNDAQKAVANSDIALNRILRVRKLQEQIITNCTKTFNFADEKKEIDQSRCDQMHSDIKEHLLKKIVEASNLSVSEHSALFWR